MATEIGALVRPANRAEVAGVMDFAELRDLIVLFNELNPGAALFLMRELVAWLSSEIAAVESRG